MKLTKEIAYTLNSFLFYMEFRYNITPPTEGVMLNENLIDIYNEDRQTLIDGLEPKNHSGNYFRKVSLEELKDYFFIALTYKETMKLTGFDGNLDKIKTNENTAHFLGTGGFIYIWETESKEREYTDQLRISTLGSNFWMKWLTIILAVSAVLTLVVEVIRLYRESYINLPTNQKTKQELTPTLNRTQPYHTDTNSTLMDDNDFLKNTLIETKHN